MSQQPPTRAAQVKQTEETRRGSLIVALNALGPWRSTVVIVISVLAVFWLWLAVVFGVLPVGPGLRNRLGGVAAGDFMFFYPVSVLVQHDAAAVYDGTRLTATGRQHLGERLPELVWPYPPTMSVALAPLGRLKPHTALAVWLGLLVAATLGLARSVLGSWPLSLIAFLCPASAFALFTGQVSPFLGLLLALFFFRFDRSPALAGVGLGLLVLKPHFGLMAGLFAMYRRNYRVVGVAAAIATLLVLMSVLAYGVRPWQEFFAQGARHSGELSVETPIRRFVTVFGAASTAGASHGLALMAHALSAVLACVAGWQLWTRAEDASMRALGLMAATVLLPPYALDYDLALLTLPWLLMIQESRMDRSAARRHFLPWVALTTVLPASYLTALYTDRSIGGVLLLAILASVWMRGRQGNSYRAALVNTAH